MLVHGKWFVRMLAVRIPELDYRRNDFPGHKEAVDYLVSGHVACHRSEVWNERVRAAAGPRIRELSDSLDVVA